MRATNNPYMHTFAASAATSYQLATRSPTWSSKLPTGPGARKRQRQQLHGVDSRDQFGPHRGAPCGHRGGARPLTLIIRNYHDSGNVASLRGPLGTLSSFLDRLGQFEAAATLAGFGLSPLAAAAVPELLSAIAHLRDVLGDEAYESLARRGEAMTMAAIAAYAYDANRPGPNATRAIDMNARLEW